MRYADVVMDLPVNRSFQYLLKGEYCHVPEPGKRVWVPFRTGRKLGYIVGISGKPEVDAPRPVLEVIDNSPIMSGELIALARWISDNYYCSWGEALSAMLPVPLRKGLHEMSVRREELPEEILPTKPHILNDEQADIFARIRGCLDPLMHKVFLVHGITGSGKTEIYLQAMQEVLSRGRSGIVLVPEISLTPQTVARFTSRFGDKVVVLHSGMLNSVRLREWKRIASGEARVVVGPRSAVFSPLREPGLFIVDEEHEPSYKQDETPRYHAREVAVERARQNGCPVILGSATPSLESFYKAGKGEYELTRLTERIAQKALPSVRVVDMRADMDMRTGKKLISRVLEDALRTDLAKKHQALVFLNRRGYSTFVMCRGCGYVMKCGMCDSPLVYHRARGEVICHYCDLRSRPPEICPECESGYLSYRGAGTQRVQKELEGLLPGARISRMDSDTMKKRGSHSRLLKDFREHKIDMLVGTQMIAKGFDFPLVTQVGVVSADANLNLPDFRSAERTFDLITQVAGRTGRGELGGEVIVQTYSPDHYAIKLAAEQDYDAFYHHELGNRRELNFPPLTHLAKLTVHGEREKDVIAAAERLSGRLSERAPELELIGPAPAPMVKLRGKYRWNILAKASSRTCAVKHLRKALKSFRKGKGIKLTVDIDPMSM